MGFFFSMLSAVRMVRVLPIHLFANISFPAGIFRLCLKCCHILKKLGFTSPILKSCGFIMPRRCGHGAKLLWLIETGRRRFMTNGFAGCGSFIWLALKAHFAGRT